MTTFYSVSAPAGSGKTFALAEHAVKMAGEGHKVLICQPTKLLIQQTWKAIKRADPSALVHTIHSPELANRSRVLAEVVAYMKAAEPSKGEVLLISQDSLNRLPHAYRLAWHLFVDEMPQGFEPFNKSVPETHRYLTQHIELGENVVGDIAPVIATGTEQLRTLSATEDDALLTYKGLADAILDDDKLVLVKRETFSKLTGGEKTDGIISFFSILQPSYLGDFKSVTVMGANLEETELYLLWQKLFDVTWKAHPQLTGLLRYNKHENGSRLTIKYFVDGGWSKDFGGKPFGSATVFDEVCRLMDAELDEDYVWQANKTVSDAKFPSGIRLPNMSHGINLRASMTANKVALVAATNHAKAASDFLTAIGFSAHEQKIIMQYQNEYQAMMRCSLRDPDATDDVTVCVVSEGSARWLEQQFPDCKVIKLANGLPEPKSVGRDSKPDKLTRGEITHRSREKARKRIADAKGEVFVPRPYIARKG